MTVKKTFRLSDAAAAKLDELVQSEGITATSVVCDAILSYGDKTDSCHTTENATRDDSGYRCAYEALVGQLEEKDKQISGIMDALLKAQETAKAAQMLHAGERLAIESSEQKKGRWERLKEAWRG